MEESEFNATECEKKKNLTKGCFRGFFCGCAAAFLILCLGIGGCFALPFMLVGNMEKVAKPVVTIKNFGPEDGAKILEIKFTGIISDIDTLGSFGTFSETAKFLNSINSATDNAEIKGLLLVVNTPGGSVTDSDRIYYALQRFKAKDSTRKIFVFATEMLCSGGYYFAMAADHITIMPTTITGSIGVIMPGFNAYNLAQRIGISDSSIASGASKDLGNPLKPENPAHKAIMQSVIDQMYGRFVMLVSKGRKLPEEKVRSLADGRIYGAQDALNLNLIDAVGYEPDVYKTIDELMGVKCYIYSENRQGSLLEYISTIPAEYGAQLKQSLLAPPKSQAQYLHR